MKTPLRALIVEDSEDDALLLVRELKRGGYDVSYERVDTPETVAEALDRGFWDIVFADYSMPRFNGITAFRLLKERVLDLPFLFVSGTIGEDIAVAAMKAGAHDYIMKGNLKRLIPAVDRELREAKVRRERKQAEEIIRYLAHHDPLTALPNRALLYDRLHQSVLSSLRDHTPMAFLLLDLDRFKEVNDTLGHQAGDLLLQQVGSRIKEVLREPDTVSRLGGDEFAILLPKIASSQDTRVVARKLLDALAPPFVIKGSPIHMEASIGVSLCPDHASDAETLIQYADVAMYAAKNGGGGFETYTPARATETAHRPALMGELHQALELGQLSLHYHPKISLKTGRVIGMEALMRWYHPQYGYIPPDQSIGPAERTGLIRPLTRWLLETAFEQSRAWHRLGVELPMALNLSARNLQDPDFPRGVEQLLHEYERPPHLIEFEITENAVMTDPARALEVITRLREIGVRFAIDDFGTGYSSLTYLRRLPVDYIKVDKSFVIGMESSPDDEVIVHSIIDLAHHLGLRVIAEGVETQDAYDRLVDLGCDAAQGFYMSQPLPEEEFLPWLAASPYGLPAFPPAPQFPDYGDTPRNS